MIGFLRFVGVMNAAIWLGSSVFFAFGTAPAIFSPAMEKLLEPKNYPYFSGAIAQIVITRYFRFYVVCALIALLHLWAEWLYLGRPWRRFSLSLLMGLFLLGLAGGFWLRPKLEALHRAKYFSVEPAERAAAGRSFRVWHGVSQVLNLVAMGGLVIYVWRVTNPADNLKFVSSVKFRG